MLKRHNPPTIAAPLSPYAHGVEVPPGARVLHVAGQVGMRPDGSVPADFRDQCEQVWINLKAVLAAAGMGIADVVKMTTFIVDKDDFLAAREIRNRMMEGHLSAATLVVISALARPAFLIEIEMTAARVDPPAVKARRPAAKKKRR